MNSLTKICRGFLQIGACGAMALTLGCSVSIDYESVAESRALIDRLPSGAMAIAWIDFEALAEALPAEQWDQYEEMLHRNEDTQALEQFEEATGIDLREDLRQMGVALMPGGAGDDWPVVLIEADFDRGRFESLLTDAESIEYEGATMYAVDDFVRNLEVSVGRDENIYSPGAEAETEPADNAYIVVLDDTTLAIGTEESLRIVIDVDGGRRETLKSDPDMNDLISEVAGHGQIWLVATKSTWDDQVADLGQSMPGAMVPATAIESIETITLSMRIGDGLSIRLAGISGSPEDAGMLTDSLNGLLSMGKMLIQGSQPELFKILDRGVHAEQDDRRITIEANLTQADLEFLQRMAEEGIGDAVIGSGA